MEQRNLCLSQLQICSKDVRAWILRSSPHGNRSCLSQIAARNLGHASPALMELITVKLFSSSRSVFSIPQPRWAGGGGYGEGRSSCCGWCRRKWWMLTMLSHGGKVILKNHYLVKTLTIHSAQQQGHDGLWIQGVDALTAV